MNRSRKKISPTGRKPTVEPVSDVANVASEQRAGSQRTATQRSGEAAAEAWSGPSPTLATVLSIWVSVHLAAIFLSFTGVVEPSSMHAGVSRVLQPYLRPTHFSADDRPVYLTHGDPLENPHRLQLTDSPGADLSSIADHQWRDTGPVGRAGLAVSDRRARWLATAAMLAESEQPGLVAELLLPVLQNEPAATAIRIQRLPTDLSEINTGVETPYQARVVRDGDQISLVQLQAQRLSSIAVPQTSTAPGTPVASGTTTVEEKKSTAAAEGGDDE